MKTLSAFLFDHDLNENKIGTKPLVLWKYNPITGFWVSQRTVTDDTKDQWMEIYKKDDPKASFVVSSRKPKDTASR